MTREEHLAWAKQRALECVDRGDLANAVASMASDLNKHEAFQGHAYQTLAALGISYVMSNDTAGVRHWMEGFN